VISIFVKIKFPVLSQYKLSQLVLNKRGRSKTSLISSIPLQPLYEIREINRFPGASSASEISRGKGERGVNTSHT